MNTTNPTFTILFSWDMLHSLAFNTWWNVSKFTLFHRHKDERLGKLGCVIYWGSIISWNWTEIRKHFCIWIKEILKNKIPIDRFWKDFKKRWKAFLYGLLFNNSWLLKWQAIIQCPFLYKSLIIIFFKIALWCKTF